MGRLFSRHGPMVSKGVQELLILFDLVEDRCSPLQLRESPLQAEAALSAGRGGTRCNW
uniref:Uncharacterized protein n=1 Tax=Anguilla anguilla TaxID=7936 RepID=A0A0E9RKV6_ANGAN